MNRHIAVLAILLIASNSQVIKASEVYRCGNHFGDMPCPGSAVVDSATPHPQPHIQPHPQPHTPNRNSIAQRDAAAAQTLHQQRLSEERAALDAQRLAGIAPPAPPVAKPVTPALPQRRRHGPPSPYFTARDADAAHQPATRKK